ncbi:transposase [Actinopolyspora biskrensis]|uniref:Transposase n=1 Tax=Actinopolyspora biskrensis TaxID=1470178 RepID=A0A852Z1N0_9ACTN|nr:hypothetical protein [Actinopolyspora biskrensis]NYH79659.1 transposase [Actinopolyspora biskrensis]
MPKFEKNDAAPTLNCTRRGLSLHDGRLLLAGGIEARPVWSRDLSADPSSVRVYRDTLGHWYRSFVVPAQTEPLPEIGPVLGVDWGVTDTATTSDDARKWAKRVVTDHDGIAVEDPARSFRAKPRWRAKPPTRPSERSRANC